MSALADTVFLRRGRLAALVLGAVAFWPTYLGKDFTTIDVATHVHATTMVLWFVLLVLQPVLVWRGRIAWHRVNGRVTFVIVPFMLALALFVMRLHLAQAPIGVVKEFADDWYIVPAMAAAFAAAYVLALRNRQRPEVHGFYMLCTALAFVNPVLQRIYERYGWIRGEARQELVNFALVDLALLALSLTRRLPMSIRKAAATMLVVFLIVEIPRFTLVGGETWLQAILWFRGSSE
jgi:hypothetical protein